MAEATALVQARALLLDTLEKDGLERVGAAGEAFDPTVHDAVAHADGERMTDTGTSTRCSAPGTGWRGRCCDPRW